MDLQEDGQEHETTCDQTLAVNSFTRVFLTAAKDFQSRERINMTLKKPVVEGRWSFGITFNLFL